MKVISKLSLALFISLFILSCSSDDDNNPTSCQIDSSLTQTIGEVTRVSDTHYSVYTDVVINASAEEVWEVLTDWDTYDDWRETDGFYGITGDVTNGNVITALFRFGTDTNNVLHLLIYQDGVRFGWSDSTGPASAVPFGGFVDHHFFEVEAISDCQSRFIQTDAYRGEGNSVFNAEAIANASMPSFQVFNAELKTEVERRNP